MLNFLESIPFKRLIGSIKTLCDRCAGRRSVAATLVPGRDAAETSGSTAGPAVSIGSAERRRDATFASS
jgi:hypothetical protein